MDIASIIFAALSTLAGIGALVWGIYTYKKGHELKPDNIFAISIVDKYEILEIHLPEIWMKTNHGDPRISLIPLTNKFEKSNIKKILKENYDLGLIASIKKVDEKSGTLNYRVNPFSGKPKLLRIHKRINNERMLQALHKVQRHIFENSVFDDSPYNECLIPIKTIAGKEYGQFKGKFFAVFPFAENAMHYSGENLDQIVSLAGKLGLVQKALTNLSNSISQSEIDLIKSNINWFETDPELFEDICRNNKRAMTEANPDRFSLLFHLNIQVLNRIWEEIKPSLIENPPKYKPILHDVHPHNSFFYQDKCALIYDYEAITDQRSEFNSLAFTIHRSIREYIRHLKKRNFSPKEKEIRDIVELFVENYKKAGRSIPVNFLQNLHLEIKIINFNKLLRIMYYHHIGKDLANRTENVLYHELEKFILYLQEAEFFTF